MLLSVIFFKFKITNLCTRLENKGWIHVDLLFIKYYFPSYKWYSIIKYKKVNKYKETELISNKPRDSGPSPKQKQT